MAFQPNPNLAWASASRSLYEAYTDFLLSRQAIMCTERTISWYAFTLDKVMAWMVANGVTSPPEISARHVRAYLSELAQRGVTDSYVNNHARAIRTMLRFFLAEDHIQKPVMFRMPTIADKRLLCLTAEQVQKVLKACNTARDKALISLMVDTGLRRAEVCALNWHFFVIAKHFA
ncbi:MAG TPA: tyrosine-type recombinase/integrase [Anaerolineales bacterium]|nr:tyrosine-type recombinase/integrase [Anaerolineales bacterium]